MQGANDKKYRLIEICREYKTKIDINKIKYFALVSIGKEKCNSFYFLYATDSLQKYYEIKNNVLSDYLINENLVKYILNHLSHENDLHDVPLWLTNLHAISPSNYLHFF